MSSNVRAFLLRSIKADTARLVRFQEALKHPFLDKYFVYAARFGDEVAYVVLLPFLFWNGDISLARQFVYMFCAIFLLVGVTKDTFCLPRPPTPPVRRLEEAYSREHGFPSAHTAAACVLPPFYVLHLLEARPELSVLCWSICAFYALSVSLSRLYVGVHSFTDVVGGAVYGFALLAAMSNGATVVLDQLLIRTEFGLAIGFAIWMAILSFYPKCSDGRAPSFLLTISIATFMFGAQLGERVRIYGAMYFFNDTAIAAAVPFLAAEGTQSMFIRMLSGFPMLLSAAEGLPVVAAKLLRYKKSEDKDYQAERMVRMSRGMVVRFVKYIMLGVMVNGVIPLTHRHFGWSVAAAAAASATAVV